jgi:hypothetical protein
MIQLWGNGSQYWFLKRTMLDFGDKTLNTYYTYDTDVAKLSPTTSLRETRLS